MPLRSKDPPSDAAGARALRVSEARYRRLFEAAQDGILLLDGATAQIEDVNPYLVEMLGYTHAELLGRKLWEVGPFADLAQSKEMFARLQAAGYVRYEHLPLQTKSGSLIAVEFVSNSYDCAGVKVIQCNIRDITDRIAAEAQAIQHARLYEALSQCNHTIVHCATEEELFPEICRIAVELGGAKMAWVGVADPETSFVRPVASWGDENGYLNGIEISVDGASSFGAGPIGRAIRENRPVWLQDLIHEPALAPWRERLALSDWSTAAALPIGLVHGAGGVLNVYSDKTAFFDEAARGLLRELADDIGFALRGFAREGQRKRAEDALKRSEDEFHTLAEAVPQIVWVTSKDGRSLYVNRRWADYTGRPVEASQGDGWLEQFHPDDRDEIEHSWRAAATAGKPYSRETRLRGKDAGYRWFLVRGAPSRDERGDVDKWFGTCTDIDDLKTAEIKLSRLNRVHAVLSGINTLILHADDRARLFDEACRIAVEAGGFRLSMMCVVDTSAMKISPVASASKDDAILAMVEGVLSSSEDAPKTMCALAVRETRVVVAQDMLHDMRVVFGPRYAACGVLSLAVFPVIVAGEIECLFSLYAEDSNFFDKEEMALLTDMVDNIAFAIDHIRQADRLDRLAYYDDLTGLANRRLFLERVGQYIRGENNRRVRIAVLIVDLSRFKNINHSLGRPAGDALLKLSASWLADNRGDANLIARLGADQFGVVLPDVAPGRDLGRLLEDMLKALTAHPFRLSESVIHVSAAFGVALYPSDGADAETLLRNAETALKLAKVNGERYLFYAATMSSATEGKLGLETRLRQALEKQEFVLHYQPKIGLASGAVISAEALIRWNDPQRGLVAPNEFIPSLEETGLIYEVGKWALATATKDSLRWRAAGLPIGRIAVNVSPLELRDRDFVADLGKILSVDPQAGAGLELEITEGVIMADVSASISSLQAIRAMGVTIAIDDFGTGFSSLSYLTRLPIDTLKIDRSFVVQMTETPEGLTLVSTIIGLARGLKLKVVAEGVEIEEQFRLLRLLGCDEMQGFFFSEPIPADVFEARYLLH